MNPDDFSYLLARKLSGEATETELEELKKILLASDELSQRHALMLKYWNEHDNATHADTESSLKKVMEKIREPLPAALPPMRRKMILRPLTAAASLLLILAGAGLLITLRGTKRVLASADTKLLQKSNAAGIRSRIKLSDGTQIWLNADSKLQYPTQFSGDLREVRLNGEAFFDVTKDIEKPFLIHLANGTVKVLGTSFNVRAYDDENKIETSVATGKVAFIPRYQDPAKKQDTLFVTPNRKLKYVYVAEELTLKPPIPTEDKAWTEGRLIFKSMRWEEIARELERNFGKKIIFVDEDIRQHRLTGYFQDNSLEEILYYLSRTSDFEYNIKNTEVEIFYSLKDRSK